MERDFNITAQCIPGKHYMVDTTAKLDAITRMIDKGLYFTINRARQFGKTTTFSLLRNRLKDKYLAAKISFEGIGDSPFASDAAFCAMFVRLLAGSLKDFNYNGDYLDLLEKDIPESVEKLSLLITDFCKTAPAPVVLMIDEVDKSANNQVFLNFLGMLRNKYIQRGDGIGATFLSVILAGVYDVKNLKLKIHGEDVLHGSGRSFNSPWNIASDFDVDMSFNPAEISTMLLDYENDHRTGMNIAEISNEIYRYTNGYPFLVSKLCKLIDERLQRDWTLDGVEKAVTILLNDDNTLFDDLFKNIENNKALYDLIFSVMIIGDEIPFSRRTPTIDLGCRFGILMDNNGKAAVSNEIFELAITNYLSAKMALEKSIRNRVLKEDIVQADKFNMQLCLEKFSGHFRELFNNNDADFLESHGRLLFITYLKPLINGQGFYHIEPQTRNLRRMDVVVDYGKQQFVIEMKLWYGDKRHEDAYQQLWDYLDAKGFDEGYLLTFDFRKQGKTEKSEWVEYNGKKIFDIIISARYP